MWTRAGRGGEERSADTDARPCVEQTAAGKPLHDTRSSARRSGQTLWGGPGVGGRLRREQMHVYLRQIHAVVQQKLTQLCKAIILQ